MSASPDSMHNALRALFAAIVVLMASGCATVPADAGNDPKDPWEGYNRRMFAFNDVIDKAVLVPAAEGYRAVVPEAARSCIRNAFENLYEPWNFVNNLLQAKPGGAMKSFMRFGVNTLFGVGGCIDVASDMEGLQRKPEDFGQTLGYWGVPDGPYFVLPIFGSSTVRDATGFVVDRYGEPLQLFLRNQDYWVTSGARIVSVRESVLDASRNADKAALDRYLFYRDAYLQRRHFLIYDGNPPEKDDPYPDGKSSDPATSDFPVDQQRPVSPLGPRLIR